jgi:predicted dienelactone hydrolase
VAYDPFARGALPVGVVTAELGGARQLTCEVWYPAVDACRGRDVDPSGGDAFAITAVQRGHQQAVRDATARIGSYPLVVFSHGFVGHRRQSSYICSHLASHGFIVAAPDHAGNTVNDLVARMSGLASGALPSLAEVCDRRVADVAALLDDLLVGQKAPWARGIDRARVALTGHSLGGWTALAAVGRGVAAGALVALAPAGGSPVNHGDQLLAALDFAWPRVVPVLFVAGREDVISPLVGVENLFSEVRAPRRLVVLDDAGHLHFADDVARTHELFRAAQAMMPVVETAAPLRPVSELAPAARIEPAVRGLVVCELDAHLLARPAALALRARMHDELVARGVASTFS